MTRRSALKATGLLALLGAGVGTASAEPTGQVGTDTDPLQTLYTAEINGELTGGQPVTDLLGYGLTVDSGALTVDSQLRIGPKLTASDGDSNDQFGVSVALSANGTTALAGAPADDDPNGTTAGSAYVLEDADGWSQVTKLSASDGDSNDQFGYSVALSEDGTTAFVGAPADEDPNGSDAGSAYVFDGSSGWSGVSTETTKLTASDGVGDDQFGYSVALSDDGTTALVGAWLDDDPNGSTAGSAYVFDSSGGWSSVSNETTKLTPSDWHSGQRFGNSVALSDDGTPGLVGARTDNNSNGRSAGAVYTFYETL